MSSVESRLWTLASEIEPTPAQKEGASRSHTYLREVLQSGQMANRILDSYLSGSYSRDTAIRPIDDVDVIFLINQAMWPVPQQPAAVAAPHVILESFASAIRYRYPVSSVFGQRSSVRLELYHLDIDVVPAIRDNAVPDFIWIPDRQASAWIKSSPKRHAAKATEVNLRQGGRLKPLIKILKLWNKNLPEDVRLKSFAVETLAITLFDRLNLQSLESGLIIFFDFIASFRNGAQKYSWVDRYGINLGLFGPVIPDLAGTGPNIIAGASSPALTRFISSAASSRDALQQAESALAPEYAWMMGRKALNIG